jgi:hypothetical protein
LNSSLYLAGEPVREKTWPKTLSRREAFDGSGGEGVYIKEKGKGWGKESSKGAGNQPSFLLQICRGDDLPRMEVLRAAQQKWKGVKWDLIDVSQITEKKELSSPEQYVLSFLQEVRTEDVEIARIGPKGERVLQVLLNIRFPG